MNIQRDLETKYIIESVDSSRRNDPMGEIVKVIKIIAVVTLLFMIAVGFYTAYEKELTIIIDPPADRISFIRLEIDGKAVIDNRFSPGGANDPPPAETYQISINVNGIRFGIRIWEKELDLEEKKNLYLFGGSEVRIVVDDSIDIDQRHS